MQKETISISAVAQILGCSQQSVREYIRQGIWNFGEVIPKKKTGKKQDRFVIYRRKFYRHIGIEEEKGHEKTQDA